MMLLMAYVNSVRLFNRQHRRERRKTMLSLAKLLAVTGATVYPTDEIREAVLEYRDDPDHYNLELEALESYSGPTLQELGEQSEVCMNRFLMVILPVALWKRELDQRLNHLEEMLLMELIPHTTIHTTWDACVEFVTISAERLHARTCRTCGGPGKHVCGSCRRVYYCSGACLKVDLQDIVMGHRAIECAFLAPKKS